MTDTEETRGLMARLSQALSKSKDALKFESESAEQQVLPVEPAEPAAPSLPLEPADPVGPPLPPESAIAEVAPEASEPPSPDIIQPRPANSYKVSPDEARDIIVRGLQRLPDFPTQGVAVVLYGSRPWNAMLTFAPGSTSHRHATFFRDALAGMVVDLRKQIDIDHGD